jgi:PAS domain-containing protein
MLRRVLTRSSLSFEIALAAALLVALVVGLLTAFNLRAQLELSRRLLEGQARGQAANVAAAAAPLVVTSQYSELDALLRRMASLPEVQRLRVLDPSGRLLSDVATVAGQPQHRFDTAVLTPPAAAAEGGTLVEYNDTTLVVWEPITAGTAIGWLRLDYSLAHLSAVRAELLRQALATALIAMVAAFVLFAAFLRRPARALEDAAAFAERLDTRRGERLSIEFQAREIERLGVALNRVSQRLAEQDRALRAVGERLRAILEHAIDGIVILDEGGRIQGLNPAAERLFGYTEAEIRGRTATSTATRPSGRTRHCVSRRRPSGAMGRTFR